MIFRRCMCRGCTGLRCPGTATSICGWELGKQKFRKRALRCHWCVVPTSSSSSSSVPDSLLSPPPPLPPSTPPTSHALELFLPDCEQQFRTIFTKNSYIPRIRHASGPCWETQLGDAKELVEDLQRRSVPHGWKLVYWSHEAMDTKMQGILNERLRRCYFAINVEYTVARTITIRASFATRI